MLKDVDIDYIEPDIEMSIKENRSLKFMVAVGGTQVTPPGITRVGGPVTAINKRIFVIDTGVESHSDLNVDRANGYSIFLTNNVQDSKDYNGHGTHVAGTIAALDNDFGVVGVAAGATIIPVRVFDASGSGTVSGVISGVNYVATKGILGDVANMSLGGGASTALDDAVKAASVKVKFAIAAGNSSRSATNFSPARVNGPNIYTVAAFNASNNTFATFSNYGIPPVDYIAPGVNVNSTWIGNSYNIISGTSMATPHVAGVLALGLIRENGTIYSSYDRKYYPIAYKN